MPRTTINDRARKARIRDREARRMRARINQIDAMPAAHMQALQQVAEAAEKGAPLAAESVAAAPALLNMGVIRNVEGKLVPSLLGKEVLADAAEAE
ncbi:MAG: hypothetical protein DYG88_15280 [Chloroflexi bacterium CFX4]|nr:hypothetical protein [Chloroflexi bacterium CFX4]MDL1922132.1 hypothetical protein [Chloroflexi bacterium CFX3]